MDLETFVSETLQQIVKGVKTAQRHADCQTARINPVDQQGFVHVKDIEFDVAVTVTEGAEKKGGIGVFSGVLGVGGQASSNTASSSVSRIKFSVPVILPTK